MPPTITGDVSMGLGTIPVEHRDAMRSLIRCIYAQAWNDGHLTARQESSQDAYDRLEEDRKAHPIRHTATKAVDAAAEMVPIFGDAFVHLRKSDGKVTATAIAPNHVTIHAPEAGE